MGADARYVGSLHSGVEQQLITWFSPSNLNSLCLTMLCLNVVLR